MMPGVTQSKAFAVLVLVGVLVIIWYLAAIWLNSPVILDRLSREGVTPDFFDLVLRTWSYTRPILPAPHQVAIDLFNSTLTLAPSNKRSLIYQPATGNINKAGSWFHCLEHFIREEMISLLGERQGKHHEIALFQHARQPLDGVETAEVIAFRIA